MTLQEVKEKINSRDFIVGALIILVGFASFGLGRLSKITGTRMPIEIQGVEQAATVGVSTPPPRGPASSAGRLGTSPYQGQEEEKEIVRGGQVVASKTGARYHFPWCGGASQIAEKNKVWFSSVEEARKAGYTPASNCKGLK